MDREINERAVISTGAQRHEVFHHDGGAAKLSTEYVCVCTLHLCVCTHAGLCLFVLG